MKLFDPYIEIRDRDEPSRNALYEIAARALKKKQRAYMFVNNGFVGNAPTTSEFMVSQLKA